MVYLKLSNPHQNFTELISHILNSRQMSWSHQTTSSILLIVPIIYPFSFFC
jgi:hypothetical protein